VRTRSVATGAVRIAATATAALLALAGCGGGSSDNSASESSSATGPAASGVPSPTVASSVGPPSPIPASGLVIHIDLVGGKPKTRPEPIVKVKTGDPITIVATADKFYEGTTPYEIHVHGFDYKLELTPGQPVVKTFTANQPAGTYEVEIENTSAHLFNLQIR
jgi:hypothetical protein